MKFITLFLLGGGGAAVFASTASATSIDTHANFARARTAVAAALVLLLLTAAPSSASADTIIARRAKSKAAKLTKAPNAPSKKGKGQKCVPEGGVCEVRTDCCDWDTNACGIDCYTVCAVGCD